MGGLLSGGSGLEFDKVNIVDPELTTPSRLYGYVWICGVEINGDFISFFLRLLARSWAYQTCQSLVFLDCHNPGQREARLILMCLKLMYTL